MYTKLASMAVEQYVKNGQIISPAAQNIPELSRQRACYIYIYQKPGRYLRAMYGRALPQHPNFAQEIVNNTITAITNPTIREIRKTDLSSLIHVVAEIAPLERISNQAQLDPDNYGLYVTSDRGKSALVHPNRPGIMTSEHQVATALREAGIDQRQEAVKQYRFQVNYYE